MTKEILFKSIENFDNGEVITPKKVAMQGCRNYYNWMCECEMVEKINGKYVKVS